jgi:hypothetical protein
MATTGPIAELGVGGFSTPILHGLCELAKRPLVSYENDPDFYEWAKYYGTDWHDVIYVQDWEHVNLSDPWSVAFVDHAPKSTRSGVAAKVVHAEYVVAHDSEDRQYRYAEILPLFKWVKNYTLLHPHTLILSNHHPVEELW